ncbi:MAG: hypothetical protein WCT14_09075 [Treponemataceae bacterium]
MKRSKFAAIIVGVAAFLLFGCSQAIQDLSPSSDSSMTQDAAFAKMDAACAAFYEGVPSAMDDQKARALNSERAITPEEYVPGVREKIIGYAMYGDENLLIAYLKEQGLYEKYLSLKAETEQASRTIRSAGTRSLYSVQQAHAFQNGTIFGAYGMSGAEGTEWLISGKWKHSSMRDDRGAYYGADPNVYGIFGSGSSGMIGSSGSSSTGGTGVGFQRTDAFTSSCAGLVACYPNGANASEGTNACGAGEIFIGFPYGLLAGRYSPFTDGFTCARIVWQAWRMAGYDTEPSRYWQFMWWTFEDMTCLPDRIVNGTAWVGFDPK